MKNSIITLLLFLVCTNGFSGNYRFHYNGRLTPAVSKEKLAVANLVSDITPDLWHIMQLPYDDKLKLERMRKADFSQGFSINQKEYNYNNIVDYVSVEIIASDNGKIISSKGTGEKLTPEQTRLLRVSGLGTEVKVKIDFKFKNQKNEKEISSGLLTVVVAPETEAGFPGGYKQLSDYYSETVFDKISDYKTFEKILMASVKFTVNEDGRITDTKIIKSSTDPYLDKLIIEHTNKMPKWNPAINSKGVKIKQEISIPFGGDGC